METTDNLSLLDTAEREALEAIQASKDKLAEIRVEREAEQAKAFELCVQQTVEYLVGKRKQAPTLIPGFAMLISVDQVEVDLPNAEELVNAGKKSTEMSITLVGNVHTSKIRKSSGKSVGVSANGPTPLMQEYMDLYDQGATLSDIAKQYDRNPSTIAAMLKRHPDYADAREARK